MFIYCQKSCEKSIANFNTISINANFNNLRIRFQLENNDVSIFQILKPLNQLIMISRIRYVSGTMTIFIMCRKNKFYIFEKFTDRNVIIQFIRINCDIHIIFLQCENNLFQRE